MLLWAASHGFKAVSYQNAESEPQASYQERPSKQNRKHEPGDEVDAFFSNGGPERKTGRPQSQAGKKAKE